MYISVCTENKERYLQSGHSVADLWGVGEILNKLEEEEQQQGKARSRSGEVTRFGYG